MIKKMETSKLTAEKRNETGTRHAKHLRRTGWIPCVIYSQQTPTQSLKVENHGFETLIRHRGGQNIIIDLDINGDASHKVMIKDIQRNNITDHILHVDFLEISMTQKLHMTVTIKLVGEPIGVTQQDGILEHLIRTVEVECLPSDIVKDFQMDISKLNVDDSLFIRDIKVNPGVTILTSGDIAVASVHMPRVEEEVKPEVEENKEGQETAEEAEQTEETDEKKKVKETEQEKNQKPEKH